MEKSNQGSGNGPGQEDVLNNGVPVCITHAIPHSELDEWVREISMLSGQPVHWHIDENVIVVKALGNIRSVIDAVRELMPKHDELFCKALDSRFKAPQAA